MSKTLEDLSGEAINTRAICASRWHHWTCDEDTFKKFLTKNDSCVIIRIIVDHIQRKTTFTAIRQMLLEQLISYMDLWLQFVGENECNGKYFLGLINMLSQPTFSTENRIWISRLLLCISTKMGSGFLKELDFFKVAAEILSQKLEEKVVQTAILHLLSRVFMNSPDQVQSFVFGNFQKDGVYAVLRLCDDNTAEAYLPASLAALHTLFEMVRQGDDKVVSSISHRNSENVSSLYMLAEHLHYHLLKWPMSPVRLRVLSALVAVVRELSKHNSAHDALVSSGLVKNLLQLIQLEPEAHKLLSAVQTAFMNGIQLPMLEIGLRSHSTDQLPEVQKQTSDELSQNSSGRPQKLRQQISAEFVSGTATRRDSVTSTSTTELTSTNQFLEANTIGMFSDFKSKLTEQSDESFTVGLTSPRNYRDDVDSEEYRSHVLWRIYMEALESLRVFRRTITVALRIVDNLLVSAKEQEIGIWYSNIRDDAEECVKNVAAVTMLTRMSISNGELNDSVIRNVSSNGTGAEKQLCGLLIRENDVVATARFRSLEVFWPLTHYKKLHVENRYNSSDVRNMVLAAYSMQGCSMFYRLGLCGYWGINIQQLTNEFVTQAIKEVRETGKGDVHGRMVANSLEEYLDYGLSEHTLEAASEYESIQLCAVLAETLYSLELLDIEISESPDTSLLVGLSREDLFDSARSLLYKETAKLIAKHFGRTSENASLSILSLTWKKYHMDMCAKLLESESLPVVLFSLLCVSDACSGIIKTPTKKKQSEMVSTPRANDTVTDDCEKEETAASQSTYLGKGHTLYNEEKLISPTVSPAKNSPIMASVSDLVTEDGQLAFHKQKRTVQHLRDSFNEKKLNPPQASELSMADVSCGVFIPNDKLFHAPYWSKDTEFAEAFDNPQMVTLEARRRREFKLKQLRNYQEKWQQKGSKTKSLFEILSQYSPSKKDDRKCADLKEYSDSEEISRPFYQSSKLLLTRFVEKGGKSSIDSLMDVVKEHFPEMTNSNSTCRSVQLVEDALGDDDVWTLLYILSNRIAFLISVCTEAREAAEAEHKDSTAHDTGTPQQGNEKPQSDWISNPFLQGVSQP